MEANVVIASILNFSVVVFVFVFFGRKPFANFMAARSEAMKKNIDDAEAAVKIAREDLAKWETNWKQAQAHAQKDRLDSEASLQRFKEKTISDAKHESDRIKKETDLLSSGELVKAKKSLQREAIEQSVELAELYLGEHLPAQEKHSLVAEFVNLVGHGTR